MAQLKSGSTAGGSTILTQSNASTYIPQPLPSLNVKANMRSGKSIIQSYNVSSVVDYGVGAIGVHILTAYPNANYTIFATPSFRSGITWGMTAAVETAPLPSTTYFGVMTSDQNGTNTDPEFISISVIGN